MATAIQFLRSSIEQLRPNPVSLSDGMPMVNFNAAEPGLFMRLSDNTLTKIGSAAVGPNAPNSTPTGQPGNSIGELWLDTTSSATATRPLLNVWNGAQWVAADGGIRADELPVPPNTFLAGPITGPDGTPTFRALTQDDLPGVLDPNSIQGGITPGVILVGGAGGWAENLLQSQQSIDVVNTDNLITLGVRAGDIAGVGPDGTIFTGNGALQFNINGQFTADNRLSFDPVTGGFTSAGSTDLGANQFTDSHNIRGEVTIFGDVTLTDLNSLNVGGDAVVGHNMTIGSDPTELLDVFNRTEFNADVAINAPSNLDVGGNLIIQGETQLGNTDVQGLVVNATSQILADLTVGRNCFDAFIVDSTATFNCDTTINGAIDLNGGINVSGDVVLGDACTDVINIQGTLVGNCDLIVGTTATITPGAAQVFTVDATTGDISALGEGSIGSDFAVGGNTALAGTLDVIGNTDINGTLQVLLDTTLQANAIVGVDLQVNQNAGVTGNLGVTGTTLLTGALTVNNSATINNNLTVLGNTIIGDNCATDTLTVEALSEFLCAAVFQDSVTFNGPVTFEDLTINGDTVIGDDCVNDTLVVTSVSTFNCATSFNDAVTIGDAATDALNIASTTTVSGPATFNDDVTVGNAAGDSLTVVSTSTLNGDTTINGDLTTTANTTIGDDGGDTLTVNASSAFVAPVLLGPLANLTVNSSATLGDAAADTLTVNATASLAAPVTFQPAANITANTDVILGTTAGNTLTVNSTSTLNSPVTIDSTLDVTGNTTIGDANTDTLTVNSAATFNDTLTVLGNTIIGDDCATDTLSVTAVTTFNCAVTFLDTLTLGDAAVDALTVNSTGTFNAPVTFNDTTNIVGDFLTEADTTIGDAAADALIVNATGTFQAPVTFNDAVTFTQPSQFEDLTVLGTMIIGDDCTTDTLTVTAVTTFNCATILNDAVTIGDNIADVITINGTLTATSPVTFGPAADFIANTDVTLGATAAETLTVKAGSIFESPVQFLPAADIIADGDVTLGLTAGDTLNVNSRSTFNSAVTVDTTLSVTGSTTLGDAATDAITINGTVTAAAPVTVNDAFTTTANTVLGDAAGDALTVNATSTFAAPAAFDDSVTLGDAAADALTVNATSTFVGVANFDNNLVANANVTLGDAAADALTVEATSLFNAPVEIDSTLTVNGDVFIGDDCATDNLTVTAVTLFNCDVSAFTHPTTESSDLLATTQFVQDRVDEAIQGLDVKFSAQAGTTGNITLSGLQTIDGVALAAGDRVLVKDQTTQSQNGVWVADGGAWTRATDMDVFSESVGAFIFVEDGTVNSDAGFVSQSVAGGTIDVNDIPFSQFSGAGSIIAGGGMTKSGNQLDVITADPTRIVVNANSIDLALTAVTAGTYRSVTVDTYGRVTGGTAPTTFAGYGLSDTSASLRATLTDETGTGSAVFAGSPTLTGTPTAPTAALGTDTTQLATTQFVNAAVSAGGLTIADGNILVGDATNVGVAVAMSGDATIINTGAITIKNDVALAGNPTTTTQAAADNSTKIATTAYTDNAVLTGDRTLNNTNLFVGDGSNVAVGVAMSGDATLANTGAITIANDAITTVKILDDAVTGAKIADNVALAGSPTTTTQTAADNSTKIATTAYTDNAVLTGNRTLNDTNIFVGDGSNVAVGVAMSGDATLANTGAITIKNDLALAGNPTTTTQAVGNNTTRVATTAFVSAAVAAATGVWEEDVANSQLRPIAAAAAHDIVPRSDGNASLGTGTLRWANVFTQDMHFSNEGTAGNDVDGTTGNWTLQEDTIIFTSLTTKRE